VILGVGDETEPGADFGPRCVDDLLARWRFPERVRVVGGRESATSVAPLIAEARALLVFGQVARGQAPGALQIVQGEKVPDLLAASAGAADLQAAIAAVNGGTRPERMALIGCQRAEPCEAGTATAAIGRQVAPAVEVALTILRGWGICPLAGDRPAARPATARVAEPAE
jgi:hydrogenase maturation protease